MVNDLDNSATDNHERFAFAMLFGENGVETIPWMDANKHEGSHSFSWVHLNILDAQAVNWLEEGAGIPYPAQRAMVAAETRPRVAYFENGLFVNLRDVNPDTNKDPEDMVSIRIWLEKNCLLTAQRQRIDAVQDIRAEITNGATTPNLGMIVARLAMSATHRMEPFVGEITDAIDEIENQLLVQPDRKCRGPLSEARHSAVLFRRYIAPQRDALTRLAADEHDFFCIKTNIELRETADAVTRLTEEIDAARERAAVLQDQINDFRSEKLNRNMLVLSVIAAIFLPLGFLTSLLGVNLGGIPGVETPIAFWILVGVCIMITALLIYLFKRMGWL